MEPQVSKNRDTAGREPRVSKNRDTAGREPQVSKNLDTAVCQSRRFSLLSSWMRASAVTYNFTSIYKRYGVSVFRVASTSKDK
jgi:hypothetical protein